MHYHGSPGVSLFFRATAAEAGAAPLPYILRQRWSTPHASLAVTADQASHPSSAAAAFKLISNAAPVLPESCSDSVRSPPLSDHLTGGLLRLPSFSESVRLIRCKDCAFYEEFAPKRNGYWNKCALRDLYNLDPYALRRCPYFTSLEPEEPAYEELGKGVII